MPTTSSRTTSRTRSRAVRTACAPRCRQRWACPRIASQLSSICPSPPAMPGATARCTWRRRLEGSHTRMPTPDSRLDPFIGYRVALATEADASALLRLAPPHPAVRALLAGQRSVTLTPREAAVLYDAAESVSRALGEPFPLQFTPVRCTRGRALQFERVALGAG